MVYQLEFANELRTSLFEEISKYKVGEDEYKIQLRLLINIGTI